MSIDVMTQALHYTRPGAIVPVTPETVKILVDALRLAIEQAERQEPVAYLPPTPHQENALYTAPPQRQPHELLCVCGASWSIDSEGNEELLSTPPQRQPLADRELDSIWLQRQLRGDILAQFRAAGRAIERKHGIGG